MLDAAKGSGRTFQDLHAFLAAGGGHRRTAGQLADEPPPSGRRHGRLALALHRRRPADRSAGNIRFGPSRRPPSQARGLSPAERHWLLERLTRDDTDARTKMAPTG